MPWQPRVEKRPHPFGEEGVRSSLEEVAKRAAQGGNHPRVKEWAGEQIHGARLGGSSVKGDRARAEILLGCVQRTKTWLPDPVGTEYIKGAHLLACSRDDEHGPCFNTGDCFPEGTLVLKQGQELASIESLLVGDSIWGLDQWSEVEAVAFKGLLSVDAIELSNGTALRLTNNHKLYVLGEEGEQRIPVAALEGGMVLAQPELELLLGLSDDDAWWSTLSARVSRAADEELGDSLQELRVTKVHRGVQRVPCWDIQTSDHRVYLPECDVTVSNCDDMCVLLAASFLSVGLNTMIVGHAYNANRTIQHVLCAARVKGEWLYADPSYDFPLGKCEPFTRERLLSVPNVKVVCDETACLTNPTNLDPDREGFVEHGVFVGVDGLRRVDVDHPQRLREVWWLGRGGRAR